MFFNKLYQTVEKYSFLFILGTYFLVNLLFMNSFWKEIFNDNSKTGARYGEVFVAEWAMDKVYQNIISGKNPFAHSDAVLYPFGLDFSTTDSGNGLFFIFLQPFLSEHQSLSIIVASGLLFANFGMYLFLRKLGISKLISFLVGLAFGNMTFLMVRLGHLNYMSTYVFPWFFLCGYTLLTSRNNKILHLSSLGTAIFFVLALYLNLYYFIMIVISIGLLMIYSVFFQKNTLISALKTNWKYIVIALICIILFLLPWFSVLYETYLFEGLPKTDGWGGAIEFSSDLFGFFIPGIYSFFLGPIAVFMRSKLKFAANIFENFSYPGIIIIFSYLMLFILKLRKKLPKALINLIKPYLFVSIGFWILTLGPFLHVFGRWGITLDEGIRIIIPLPYILFHYLPFMANIRIPGRLIVAFIFFSYISCAYLFDHFLILHGKTRKMQIMFFALFMSIFFLDHYFIVTTPPSHFIPVGAYQTIAKDPDKVTVFEAPSVVRDGFTYFGYGDGLGFIEGQLIHNKPVLAGYLGRIPYFKINYYKQNPFLGFMGRLMDDDLARNGGVEKNDLSNWKKLDTNKSIDSINFLDLKYFLLDDSKSYSSTVSAILTDLGFNKIQLDNYFSLWQREPEKKEYLSVDVGKEGDDMFLGAGWNTKENGFRWAWKNSSVMFKVAKPRKFNLNFQTESFRKEQKVTIYVNKKKVTEVTVPTRWENYSIPISSEIKEGINFVYFIFSSAFRPSEINPTNTDNRLLSAKFRHISLREKN